MSRNINPVPCLFFPGRKHPSYQQHHLAQRLVSLFREWASPLSSCSRFPPAVLRKTLLRQKQALRPAPFTEPSPQCRTNALFWRCRNFGEALRRSRFMGAPLSADTRRARRIRVQKTSNRAHTPFPSPCKVFKVHHEASGTQPQTATRSGFYSRAGSGCRKGGGEGDRHLYRYGNRCSATGPRFTNAEIISIPTPQEKVKDILPFTPGVIKTLDSKTDFQGRRRKSEACCWSIPRGPPIRSLAVLVSPSRRMRSNPSPFTKQRRTIPAWAVFFRRIDHPSRPGPPDDQYSFKTERNRSLRSRQKKAAWLASPKPFPASLSMPPLIPHKLLLSGIVSSTK